MTKKELQDLKDLVLEYKQNTKWVPEYIQNYKKLLSELEKRDRALEEAIQDLKLIAQRLPNAEDHKLAEWGLKEIQSILSGVENE